MDFDSVLTWSLGVCIVLLIVIGCVTFIWYRQWLSDNESSLTILLLIVGIVIAVGAAYVGAVKGAEKQAQFAYEQDLQKNKLHEDAVARMFYLDLIFLTSTIDRQNATITCFDKQIKKNPDSVLGVVGTIYPDNALWYSYRTEIAGMNMSISSNLTRFYNDMMFAEVYRNEMNSAISQNSKPQFDISYQLFKLHIQDSYEIHSVLIEELKNEYNISESIPNTIYQFRTPLPC